MTVDYLSETLTYINEATELFVRLRTSPLSFSLMSQAEISKMKSCTHPVS